MHVTGGVITAENAWKEYQRLKLAIFDVSSYEYSITLLCQALRTQDALERIEEMKAAFGIHKSQTTSNNDQSLTEALAVVHLALARAYTILGAMDEAIEACKKSLAFSVSSRKALKSETSFSRKRGWKESNENRDNDRRAESNTIYRDHRLSEIEEEAKTVVDICRECDTLDSAHGARKLARRLVTRLIFLSGGGTTNMIDNQTELLGPQNSQAMQQKTIQKRIVNSLYFNFGLAAVVNQMTNPVNNPPFNSLHQICSNPLKALNQKECNRILGDVGLQGGIIKEDGTLDLHRIFAAGLGNSKTPKKRSKKSRRIEVELGAGFGDWIVQKAIEDPSTDFMAVELRADRVAQIFARTAILSASKPIDNLCIVGGDSGALLHNQLQNESIDSFYINHPEPPTQTFGTDSQELLSIMNGGLEPAHMLNSHIILSMAKVLKKKSQSRLVIVTDNKWYGRLICATIQRVLKNHPDALYNVDISKLSNRNQRFKLVPFGEDGQFDIDDERMSVMMFEGQPDESIGYPAKGKNQRGESYFDRLWRSGGGSHAEKRTRFIIVMKPAGSD